MDAPYLNNTSNTETGGTTEGGTSTEGGGSTTVTTLCTNKNCYG